MPTFRLQWNEVDTATSHPQHIAKDDKGTVYRIRPVYYSKRSGGKFAGWRVSVGNKQIRGWKTMLHEAKASAQRQCNRLNPAPKKLRLKRVLDLDDIEPVAISIPIVTIRMIDLD
jgi:hypothetical protein